MPESEINDDAEEQLPPKEDPALLARLRSDGEQVLLRRSTLIGNGFGI